MKTSALLTKVGPDGQELFFVSQSAVLGSSGECDLAVRNAAPKHCRVSRSGAGFEARDLTGQGLIKINGKSTSGAILQEGDVLEVGLDSFRFSEVLEAAAEPDPEAESTPAPRPSRRESRRIPIVGPRLEKARSGGSSGTIPKVVSSESRRRIPVIPITVAGGLLVAALAGILLASGSSAKTPKAPTPQKPVAAPGAAGDRGPRPSEASLRSTAPASARAAAPVERSAASRDPGSVSSEPDVPAPRAVSASPVANPAGSGPDASLRNPLASSEFLPRTGGGSPPPLGSLRSEVLRAAALAVGWNPSPGDLKGAPAQVWAAYAKGTSFETVELLSPADHVARATTLLEGGRVPLFRLFALAHLVEAWAQDQSVRSLLEGAGYKLTQDGKRWGEVASVFQERLVHYLREGGKDDPALEAQARESADFGTRYLGLLVEIDRSLRRGAGYQAVWNDLTVSGAPDFPSKGAA
ncbi:MAG TPA: hypothetical protein VEN81_07980, partial [Planctomycetota bacterium]|nr:hypothetical protein [Planctomycetota bacterium]